MGYESEETSSSSKFYYESDRFSPFKMVLDNPITTVASVAVTTFTNIEMWNYYTMYTYPEASLPIIMFKCFTWIVLFLLIFGLLLLCKNAYCYLANKK